MRFPLLLACATLLASAIVNAGAADVWVEGRWENINGQHQWRAGYWQASTVATTAPSAPSQVWVEGRWAQGANGWVWVEGHYETPPHAPQPVVVQQPVIVQAPCPPPQPVVVVERPCPPTVVIGATYGYGYGYNSYGYHTHRPVCAPQPVYCPPSRPVVVCPPTPVYCPPQRPVSCPSVYRGGSVRVSLPRPSLVFPTVKVGSHRLPLPPLPVIKRR